MSDHHVSLDRAMAKTKLSEGQLDELTEALHAAETSGGWWGHPECQEFARIISADVARMIAEASEAGIEEGVDSTWHLKRIIADAEQRARADAFAITAAAVEAACQDVGCANGSTDACLSIRCGSNCHSKYDRMHPCPACSIRAALSDTDAALSRVRADQRERDAVAIEAHRPALPDWPIAERAGWEHGHANAAAIVRGGGDQ